MRATFADRLAATMVKLQAVIVERRTAGLGTVDLEAHVSELDDYLVIERGAAARREELAAR